MDDSQVVEMTRASNQIFGSGTKGQRFESSRAYSKGCCQVAFFLLVGSYRGSSLFTLDAFLFYFLPQPYHEMR